MPMRRKQSVTDVRDKIVSRRQFGRWLLVLACLGLTLTASPHAWAQNKDKKPPANKQADPKAAEGEGGDAAEKEPAPLKLEVDALTVPGIILGVISLLWACSSVWIVKDSRRQGLGSKKWKKIVVAPYAVLAVGLLACVGLNWTDYAFLEAGGLSLGIGLLAAVWLVTLVLYLVARNRALNDTGEVVAAPPEVRKAEERMKNGMAVSRNFSFMAPTTAVASEVALSDLIRTTMTDGRPSATPMGARTASKPKTPRISTHARCGASKAWIGSRKSNI